MSPTAPRPTVTPLTPRPKLFALLCLVLAAWVGFLIWMYFATVYPQRHPTTNQTAAFISSS